jgi:hypothetical protein
MTTTQGFTLSGFFKWLPAFVLILLFILFIGIQVFFAFQGIFAD